MSATKAAIEDRPSPINCVLVAGGKYHDIDFARLELLKLLAEEPRFRVRVLEDYEDTAAITAADCLISYTCDFVPSLPAQEALRDWLEAGGRWYALHGTNSILRLLKNGLWDSPRAAPLFMELLGSQFISHPPIAPYRVTVANADHPLVSGVEAFETDCELYHLETHGELEVLLETQCDEPAADFVEGDGAVGTHPVCYIKQRG
ncbi:MAG: ThuA domain-containing protein, partial [Pseudomonadota bacterium]